MTDKKTDAIIEAITIIEAYDKYFTVSHYDTINELKKMVGLDIDELTDEEAREIAECDRFEYERGN